MNAFVYSLQDTFLNIFVVFSYVALVLVALDIHWIPTRTVQVINEYVKLYVCAFLLIRFRPFLRKPLEFTELDRKVVFSAGMFLLASSLLTSYASDFKNFVVSTLKPTTQEVRA